MQALCRYRPTISNGPERLGAFSITFHIVTYTIRICAKTCDILKVGGDIDDLVLHQENHFQNLSRQKEVDVLRWVTLSWRLDCIGLNSSFQRLFVSCLETIWNVLDIKTSRPNVKTHIN